MQFRRKKFITEKQLLWKHWKTLIIRHEMHFMRKMKWIFDLNPK